MPRLYLLVLAAMLSIACSKPRLDATTDETIAASTRKMSLALPEDQRDKFRLALLIIRTHKATEGASGLDTLERGMAGELKDTRLLESLNGKTADEIIALADRIAAEPKRPRPR